MYEFIFVYTCISFIHTYEYKRIHTFLLVPALAASLTSNVWAVQNHIESNQELLKTYLSQKVLNFLCSMYVCMYVLMDILSVIVRCSELSFNFILHTPQVGIDSELWSSFLNKEIAKSGDPGPPRMDGNRYSSNQPQVRHSPSTHSFAVPSGDLTYLTAVPPQPSGDLTHLGKQNVSDPSDSAVGALTHLAGVPSPPITVSQRADGRNHPYIHNLPSGYLTHPEAKENIYIGALTHASRSVSPPGSVPPLGGGRAHPHQAAPSIGALTHSSRSASPPGTVPPQPGGGLIYPHQPAPTDRPRQPPLPSDDLTHPGEQKVSIRSSRSTSPSGTVPRQPEGGRALPNQSAAADQPLQDFLDRIYGLNLLLALQS